VGLEGLLAALWAGVEECCQFACHLWVVVVRYEAPAACCLIMTSDNDELLAARKKEKEKREGKKRSWRFGV
jgi:hypothetical protein